MIFPFLLSGVFILKFYLFIVAVFFFRELDYKNIFLVACCLFPPFPPPPAALLPLPSVLPPPGTGPGNVTIEIPK